MISELAEYWPVLAALQVLGVFFIWTLVAINQRSGVWIVCDCGYQDDAEMFVWKKEGPYKCPSCGVEHSQGDTNV